MDQNLTKPENQPTNVKIRDPLLSLIVFSCFTIITGIVSGLLLFTDINLAIGPTTTTSSSQVYFEKTTCGGGRGGHRYPCTNFTYTFVVNGKEYSSGLLLLSQKEDGQTVERNNKVDVIYKTDNPSINKPVSGEDNFMYIYLVFMFVFFGAPTIFVWVLYIKSKKKKSFWKDNFLIKK
jgi:hypothetical protein